MQQQLHRRIVYQPSSAQEQFIVPLVARNIEQALKAFAAPLGKGKKVLDVGCGGQPLRATLLEMGLQYTSADVQQNTAGTVDVIAAIDQPMSAALLERAPFDFIVCTEVLEHVADWDMAFRNLSSLLSPGGRMLVTCPHVYPLHEVPHDYWRPTPYALRHFATRAGLKILQQENSGDGLDVLGTVLASARPTPRAAGWLDRLLSFTCDIARKAAFVLLRSSFLRRRVTTSGAIYLSNLVVLERPDATRPDATR